MIEFDLSNEECKTGLWDWVKVHLITAFIIYVAFCMRNQLKSRGPISR